MKSRNLAKEQQENIFLQRKLWFIYLFFSAVAHRASTRIHSTRSMRFFKILPPCVQSASLYTDNLWSKWTKFWALLILEVSSSLLINSFLPYLPQFWSDWSAKPAVFCALPSFAFTNRNFKAWYWPFTGTISSKFNLILSQTVLRRLFLLRAMRAKDCGCAYTNAQNQQGEKLLHDDVASV